MSSYTAPFTFANTNLLTQDWDKNEESLKLFINQEIIDTDIADKSLGGENLMPGKLYLTANSYNFETSAIGGTFEDDSIDNQSFQTATTKNNNQTEGNQFQDVTNAGQTITLSTSAIVIITYYLHSYTPNNEVVAGNEGPGNGKWNNEFRLKVFTHENNTASRKTGSTGFCFEGIGSASDNKDPGYGNEAAQYRSIMLTYRIQLGQGTFTLIPTLNPHSEVNQVVAKNIVVEAFYL